MKKSFATLCAVLLVFSMVIALASCDFSEEIEENTTDTVQYTPSNTVLKKSSEEVLLYFNTLVNSVKAKTPAVSYTQELKIDNKTLKITKADGAEDDSLKSFGNALPGLKDLILTDIKKKSGSVGYGSDSNDVFFVKGESWASALTADDIDSAVIKEVGDKYYITIVFGNITEESKATLAKAFQLRDKATMLNSPEFAKISSYLEIKDYEAKYSGCTVTATVDRLTDTLVNVSYNKVSDISAQVTGLSTFADYGDMAINFVLGDTTVFNFVWSQNYETSPLEISETT